MMDKIYTHNPASPLSDEDLQTLSTKEWLVTNGLGGYASGTLGGGLTRVFHGYLISALQSPLGRTMMLNQVLEDVVLKDGSVIHLNGLFTENRDYRGGSQYLTSFSLINGLPVWTYEVNNLTLEKRLVLPHRQNTVYISYRLIGGEGTVRLRLRPAVNMREHEAPVSTKIQPYTFTVRDHHYELKATQDIPALKLVLIGKQTAAALDPLKIQNVTYELERSRGYSWRGDLWSPGYFSMDVSANHSATLLASTEAWDIMAALDPQQAWDAEHERKQRLIKEARPGACDEPCRGLVWAADQFMFTPVGRQEDAARARAAGHEIRSVIAGYHWFTDWGRDTMISLEGLALTTGRDIEAGYILRTFAHYIRDGLIPNMFPEGKKNGLYHTADATLWFFHALNKYAEYTNDRHLLDQILPSLVDIIGHHLRGTRFGIHVDSKDGLLIQGAQGYQLTWMDAKVDDWVVTPRRGKAVEINALWYNALCLLEGWLRDAGRDDDADGIAKHAAKARASFNDRFWYKKGKYLYDVVDGENGRDDHSLRPNQIFAISLEHPVLDPDRWEPVLEIVQNKLLTPVGLRSLGPDEPDFKPRYDGDLRSRDAAYHQGTVWGWLIGPFIDAYLKVHPDDRKTARGFLAGFKPELLSACIGQISEIFDAEPPFTARGCCAQAWSVAEVLRSFVNTRPVSEKLKKRQGPVAVLA